MTEDTEKAHKEVEQIENTVEAEYDYRDYIIEEENKRFKQELNRRVEKY
jgi:hypothetical protein